MNQEEALSRENDRSEREEVLDGASDDDSAPQFRHDRMLSYKRFLDPIAATALAIHLALIFFGGFSFGFDFVPILGAFFGFIAVPLCTWALTRRLDHAIDFLLGDARGLGGAIRLFGAIAFLFATIRLSAAMGEASIEIIQRTIELTTALLSISVMTSLAFLGLGAADIIYEATARFKYLSTRLMILLALSSIANFLWLSLIGLQARALIAWAVKQGHLEIYVDGIEKLERFASAYVGGVAGALSLELPFLLLLAWRFGRNATRGLVSLRRGFKRVELGRLDAPVPVIGNDEVAEMQRGFNRMLVAAQERQMLETAFGRYVSPLVLDQLRAHGGVGHIAAERRVASVLFSDIRGFTALSAGLAPETVIAILNAYMSSMIDCIARYDGYINKFVGDAIMVVWGAPLDQHDHALRAVCCAREMMRVLEDANARGGFAGHPLEMGIGVNTGPLVAGNLGNSRQVEYTVIGDSVNVASRACSAADAHEVAVTAAVCDAVNALTDNDPGALVTTSKGMVSMKGKGEVELFLVDKAPGEEVTLKHRTSSSLLVPVVDLETDESGASRVTERLAQPEDK